MSTVFNFTFVPWFRSVAPYIHMHRGKTFVVGIAGEAIAAGKLQNLAQDLALIQSMGVKIVLVHGFRPQVNEQLAAKGHTPKYAQGIRITDSLALDCAQEAAGQLRGLEVDDSDFVLAVAAVHDRGVQAAWVECDIEGEISDGDLFSHGPQRPLVGQQHRAVALEARQGDEGFAGGVGAGQTHGGQQYRVEECSHPDTLAHMAGGGES